MGLITTERGGSSMSCFRTLRKECCAITAHSGHKTLHTMQHERVPAKCLASKLAGALPSGESQVPSLRQLAAAGKRNQPVRKCAKCGEVKEHAKRKRSCMDCQRGAIKRQRRMRRKEENEEEEEESGVKKKNRVKRVKKGAESFDLQ